LLTPCSHRTTLSHFSAAVSGNEMLAETVESKLIFSRAR